jgi:2',3'-cyclic-nucleotide 2'-phosphodiesterase (5'-nucleotidase family)
MTPEQITVFVTIITAINATRSNIAKQKADDLDLTEKLQKLSKELLDQMDEKVKDLEKQLKSSRTRERKLRDAGLILINGITQSIKARTENQLRDGPTCAACLEGDRILLTEVIKIKELFEREE